MEHTQGWLSDVLQVPLKQPEYTQPPAGQSVWLESAAIPAYCAAISASILTARHTSKVHKDSDRLREYRSVSSQPSYLSRRIRSVGSSTILAMRLVQWLVIPVLLCLSLFEIFMIQSKFGGISPGESLVAEIVQCAVYGYLSLLGAASVLGNTKLNLSAFNHVSVVLAIAWGISVYHDIWPLAISDPPPLGAVEGVYTWVKLGLLTLGGVIIPLFTPKKYIPVDPKDPLEPNPEQTASLASLVFYGFLEFLVWRLYRLSRVTSDMLPPLPDYEHLKHLVGRSFPYLDPMRSKSRKHLALLFLRVFRPEVYRLTVTSMTGVIGAIAGPFSVNKLLLYLESGKAGTTIKPWFWVVLFFCGRMLKDLSDQLSTNYSKRLTVRLQAIITELVFEHALRLRVKADTAEIDDAAQSHTNTESATPDTASQLDPDSTVAGETMNCGGAGTGQVEQTLPASSSTAADGTTDKGKGKERSTLESGTDTSKKAKARKPDLSQARPSTHLAGKLNNLVTSDLNNLENVGAFAVFLSVRTPLEVTLCIIFLYRILGWSAFVGLAVMIITLPLPGRIATYIQGTQREKMKRTDARVQLVTEMLNVIRMIKLFGWESRAAAQLDEKRRDELVQVRNGKLLVMLMNLCNYLLPILIMLSTYVTYTVIMKEQLTASRVFSSIIVFDMLRGDLKASFFIVPQLIEAKVSLERIADFLRNTELIDEFEREREAGGLEPWVNAVPEDRKGVIGIRRASFTWSKDAVSSQSPDRTHKRTFILNIDNELIFQRGKINLIIGPTGAGKTSLLMALLGEMHYIPTGPDSFVSLPRQGGVAYAAQESWVQNETIKDNILFGAPYDDVRYNKVLHQCALRHDLSLFDAGDQTEVGEKGITLSGGQKARITLARAVYSQAEIVLLDDILAALDVHTSKWIVEKCLKGDLLQGRTILLVTHNVAMVSSVADFVVDVGSDGHILSQGSFANALARDSKLLREVETERFEMEKAVEGIDVEKPEDAVERPVAGKLVVAEEIEEGFVGWSALKLYICNMSKTPVVFWMIYISGHILGYMIFNIQSWYLGYWASQYENHPPEEVSVPHYLAMYTLLATLGVVAAVFSVCYYLFGSIRAARIIHQELVTSVLGTTLRWLDKTPTSRIVARCTADIQTVDTRIAGNTAVLAEVTIEILLKLLAVVLFSPSFIIPAVVISLSSGIFGHVFVKVQLCVMREMSACKAPVLAHFGAAISGITSVRAYGAQEAFKAESYRRIDRYTRVAVTNRNLARWLHSRIDLMAILFSTGLAVHLIYLSDLGAANTGFSLTMALAVSNLMNFLIRTFTDFEICANSLERIQQYLIIEQEPRPTPEGIPPAYWPASGQLEVENLSARYSQDGPRVLHEVSFEVSSGERVGIVGRTGSGKSSLTLALLRCILTEGIVRYDGLPTDKVNLNALRSKITIIPQVPELLSGTLRQNLDPFSEHDDSVLNDALRSAGLFNLQDENDESRITLDTEIAGGGANLSVGQRQVLALARAIVRRSKLLILDEATSAIDYKTDSIIQTSLRTELGKDVTLLTVAHRLQTIMDADKIMVLDAGRIVEFGKPSELLEKEGGMLRALVEESGDKEKLYEMAMGPPSPPS
ncbi:P-loop containing nucleoside triphosphate hydrolase protein [Trametes punicea]|nr:P-loop containing nucleoside triphosphate hydrolase protein [Trametes punicea]